MLRGGPFSTRRDKRCFVSPQRLVGTNTQAEAVAATMGSEALAAQPVICFAQMLCVTKAPLSPFLLDFRITWGGGRGEMEIKDIAKMQILAAGSAGPDSKMGGRRLQVMLEKPQAAAFPAQQQQKQSCFSCLCCSLFPS